MSPICKSVLNEKLLVDTCMYEIHVCVEMYKYKCKFAYSFGCGTWEIIFHLTGYFIIILQKK